MSKIKILIVEDDPIQAMQMADDLTQMNYMVIGEAENFQEGHEYLLERSPDLILIDINLTGQAGDTSGIELGKIIQNKKPTPFIYITGSEDDNTFQNAIKVKPQHYIVKPYRKKELYHAIELAMLNFKQVSKPIQKNDFIVVKDNLFLKKVFFDEIAWIEAEGALKKIYTIKSNHYETTWATMEELEEQLASGAFIQTHRSFIINLNFVEQYKGGFVTILGQQIPVGRAHKENLQNRLRTL